MKCGVEIITYSDSSSEPLGFNMLKISNSNIILCYESMCLEAGQPETWVPNWVKGGAELMLPQCSAQEYLDGRTKNLSQETLQARIP